MKYRIVESPLRRIGLKFDFSKILPSNLVTVYEVDEHGFSYREGGRVRRLNFENVRVYWRDEINESQSDLVVEEWGKSFGDAHRLQLYWMKETDADYLLGLMRVACTNVAKPGRGFDSSIRESAVVGTVEEKAEALPQKPVTEGVDLGENETPEKPPSAFVKYLVSVGFIMVVLVGSIVFNPHFYELANEFTDDFYIDHSSYGGSSVAISVRGGKLDYIVFYNKEERWHPNYFVSMSEKDKPLGQISITSRTDIVEVTGSKKAYEILDGDVRELPVNMRLTRNGAWDLVTLLGNDYSLKKLIEVRDEISNWENPFKNTR